MGREAMAENLEAEHARLRRQTRELQREHDKLAREQTVDIAAHEQHRLRLQEKIRELREHMKRIHERMPHLSGSA